MRTVTHLYGNTDLLICFMKQETQTERGRMNGDSLLLDVDQGSRRGLRQGGDADVSQRSGRGVCRSEGVKQFLRFHFDGPDFLFPPLILHLLLWQGQIKECWGRQRQRQRPMVIDIIRTALYKYWVFSQQYSHIVPLRPIFVLERMSASWMSEVIRSGSSWINGHSFKWHFHSWQCKKCFFYFVFF